MVESLLLTTVNQFINSTSLGVVVVLILIAISIVLLSLVKLRKNGIEDNKKTKLKWLKNFSITMLGALITFAIFIYDNCSTLVIEGNFSTHNETVNGKGSDVENAVDIVLNIRNITGGTTSIEKVVLILDDGEVIVYDYMKDDEEKSSGFREGQKVDGHSSCSYKWSIPSRNQEIIDHATRRCVILTSDDREYECQVKLAAMSSSLSMSYTLAS